MKLILTLSAITATSLLVLTGAVKPTNANKTILSAKKMVTGKGAVVKALVDRKSVV